MPFTYQMKERRSFRWVDSEELMYRTELAVIRAAAEIACLCDEVEDSAGVTWAVRQGLRASPTNSDLTRILMETQIGAGDIEEARHTFEHHANEPRTFELGEPEDGAVPSAV